LITLSFISDVESSSFVVPIVIMFESCVMPPLGDFFIVLSSVIVFLSMLRYRHTYAFSAPCLRIDVPFCPGCSPKSANCNPRRIDVFPEPMSPAKRTEPFGNSIVRFS